MDISRRCETHAKACKNITRWPKSVYSDAERRRNLHASMRTISTAKITEGLFVGIVCAASLCERGFAPRVGVDFINNGRTFEGSRMEFRSPEGHSCRYDNSDRPSISMGFGVADPQIIPSSYSYDQVYPAKVHDVQPVGGIVVRVPFGKDPDNCDEILRLEANKMSLTNAQELFENGLIEEDQLKRVADKVYANLLRTVKD